MEREREREKERDKEREKKAEISRKQQAERKISGRRDLYLHELRVASTRAHESYARLPAC